MSTRPTQVQATLYCLTPQTSPTWANTRATPWRSPRQLPYTYQSHVVASGARHLDGPGLVSVEMERATGCVPGFARRGSRGSHLDPAVRGYLEEAKEEVYRRPERPTVTAVRHALEAQVAVRNQGSAADGASDDGGAPRPLSTPAWTTVDRYLGALAPGEADEARLVARAGRA